MKDSPVGIGEGQECVETGTEGTGLHLDHPFLVGGGFEAEDIHVFLGADAAIDHPGQGQVLGLFRGVVGFGLRRFVQITHLKTGGIRKSVGRSSAHLLKP